MTIATAILRLREQATSLNIPARRLYLGLVKARQLEEWASTELGVDIAKMEGEFEGMIVVRMKEPGMAIGE